MQSTQSEGFRSQTTCPTWFDPSGAFNTQNRNTLDSDDGFFEIESTYQQYELFMELEISPYSDYPQIDIIETRDYDAAYIIQQANPIVLSMVIELLKF